MTDERPENLDFEAALRELEELVASLEQGDLGLEESLRRFERGVRLTRLCQEALRRAEQKVRLLAGSEQGETEEGVEARPFPDTSDGPR